MRNRKKAITEGRKLAQERTRLDMYSHELQSFISEYNASVKNGTGHYDALCDIIIDSYCMGLSIGNRNK